MIRRAAFATAGLVVIVLVAVLALGSSSAGEYRVAALFDTAKGMVAGQQVKVAGAVVGSVSSVQLAAGPRARIVMSVQRRYAPFHQNATCTILPEGLISENFVQCDPGSGAPLGSDPAGLPTVPLSHTTVPFSLPDVLNVLSLPTDERIQVVISQLGIGTAGQGGNLNALLRRANPALENSQQLLGILNAQREQLAGAVGQTDEILAALAQRRAGVRQFVDRAAALTAAMAAHRAQLGSTIARLPGLLAAVRPGLRALDTAARNATPLLPELRAAAPSLAGLARALPAFAHAAIPALRTLGTAAVHGTPAVRLATPVASRLSAASGPLATLGDRLSPFLVSAREAGAIEGLLSVVYAFATNTSLYDGVSHMLTFLVSVAPQCIIGQEGGFDVPGCGHSNTSPAHGQVPLNEPSCGARSESFETATCPPAAPGPFAFARLSSATRSGLWRAIDTAMSGGRIKPSVWSSLAAALGLRPGAGGAASASASAPRQATDAGGTRSASAGPQPARHGGSGPDQPPPAKAAPAPNPAPAAGAGQAVTSTLSSLLNYLLR